MRRPGTPIRRCRKWLKIGPFLLPCMALAATLTFAGALWPKTWPAGRTPAARLLVIVNDENGVAVPLAIVTLARTNGETIAKGETNYAGRREFRDLTAGEYVLRVEKEGFYAVKAGNVQVGKTESTEVTLNHVREYHQRVDVVASPSSINPAKTSSTSTLNDKEIMSLPFTVPRDIRYALPLLPGVLQDATGQVHVNGSPTRQILDELDGFNITDPVSGNFDARVPVEALRTVTVMGSRYPAQDGKAVGGLLDLTTGMGDDRYRLSATDFLPSFSSLGGFHIASWLPRGGFSGPLKKGKAWFLLAPEFEYNSRTINDLPPSADRTSNWRFGDLAKAQVNLTPSNILTTTLLVNDFRSHNAGLSRFDPVETTTNLSDSVYHMSVKDQSQLSDGALMEYGVAFSRFHTLQLPMGNQAYVMTPEGTSGNYFERAQGRSERWQAIANLVTPTVQALGSHEVRVGIDLDRLAYRAAFSRHEILIRREDGTLSRTVTFPGSPSLAQTNFETGAYAQDHWSVSDRLVIDPGVRLDWDQIVPGTRVSPRLAASFLPTSGDKTKIVAGAGIYYDQSSLDLYTRPLDGTRIDTFFDPTGQFITMPPVDSVFQIDRQNLRAPWFLNWSLGLEQRLPAAIFLRAEYLQKRGHTGWTYTHPCEGASGCFSGRFILESQRRDRYDAVDFSMRRRFKGGHALFASYVRSTARTNAVLDYNLNSLFFSPQLGGPLPWDTPNRFLSWGILPFLRKLDLVYLLDWRDGFPFSVVNQNQELVGSPGRLRFPEYFSLNLALEMKVSLFGFRWEVRGGFDDITNRQNPDVVDNNIDSPTYLTFGSAERRALTGQIRLLGRK
ncbi:MAG TPA: TonB-dependent receptor [Terriglobia bacterium]|nr:TonB-dependent receptor [Terriglobia bacterium]